MRGIWISFPIYLHSCPNHTSWYRQLFICLQVIKNKLIYSKMIHVLCHFNNVHLKKHINAKIIFLQVLTWYYHDSHFLPDYKSFGIDVTQHNTHRWMFWSHKIQDQNSRQTEIQAIEKQLSGYRIKSEENSRICTTRYVFTDLDIMRRLNHTVMGSNRELM